VRLPEPECRENELVTRHATLVKRIARHVMNRLPASVQLDDLLQAGLIGLMEAARSYDPSQGASFETYATIRVRGAILDELRRNDWAPRSLSRRSRQLSEAARAIESRQGRAATAQEIADVLGLTLEEYHHWVLEASNQNFFSLDQIEDQHGECARSGDTTYGHVENGRLQGFLAEAIGWLSDREQLVLSLYYDRDLTLKEIGEVLGVSESRVCQIHGEAAMRLRARMGSWT
jgi:RNA polymerase sigma factor for flagellar operon FliA